ncbi:NADH dehydrogenase [ubiquinone] 1 beta subcomplex subunit 5, mitochondrial-like [Mytilus galloprovincialis]|uniref:NADH dehydrogenase [ubiquinone] 1 beta subcomplex subunit 5, mitochondrial-like n=1 Tax=Mytilus galloprovincialis TaxID=29158 RepID=UPI003F7B9806
MGVLSCLRPSIVRGTKQIISLSTKHNALATKTLQSGIVRQMGGGGGPPTMIKTASRSVYNTLKDEFHFFFWVGAIPCILIVAAFNIFGGQGELTDIPEGYQPHHWEYEKHPIRRFIAKHFTVPMEKIYEQNLHYQWMDNAKNDQRILARKIRAMMRENQDYKAWYYIPVDVKGKEEAAGHRRAFEKRHSYTE